MAALSAVPTDVYDDHKTTIFTSLSSGTSTTIVLTALQRNGSTVSWAATAGILKVTDGSQVEHIGFNGISVDSTTKNVTLTSGGITRDLVWNTTSWTTGGNGIKWTAGVQVELVWDSRHVQQTVFKDQTSTLGASGKIVGSSTTLAAFGLNPVTTSQRTAITGTNGDLIYDSDLGQVFYWAGGAWNAVGNTGTSNASTTVAGKIQLATVAQQGTATANGSTGAALVPANANLVSTSAGAGDVSKIPILNASGVIATSILGTGTPASSKYVDGAAGAWTSLPSAGSVWTLRVRYARTSGDYTTTSGSYADIDGTNMTTTFTCTASTVVVIILTGSTLNSGSNQARFDFSVGGSTSTNALAYVSSGTQEIPINIVHVIVPGAGSKVVKAQWKTGAGTQTLRGGSTADSMSVFTVLSFEP